MQNATVGKLTCSKEKMWICQILYVLEMITSQGVLNKVATAWLDETTHPQKYLKKN
jgi:hypothetical protein